MQELTSGNNVTRRWGREGSYFAPKALQRGRGSDSWDLILAAWRAWPGGFVRARCGGVGSLCAAGEFACGPREESVVTETSCVVSPLDLGWRVGGRRLAKSKCFLVHAKMDGDYYLFLRQVSYFAVDDSIR